MTNRYDNGEKIYVAVDCIIFGFDEGVLKLLVFKRLVNYLKDELSLIGSFIKPDENANEAARRVLKEITGLENIFMEELKTYTDVDRDSGARCISIAQYSLIRLEDYDKQLVKKHGAQWFEINDLPKLVLDHDVMVQDALTRLRNKSKFYPIGIELLPKQFTIPQLQNLYEVIHQKKLDSRNFRKKLLSLNLLIALNKKDKSSSKKGAFLYKFDYKKYKKLEENGFNFSLFK
ncbi:NUDIX hydrolase [Siansivirga zeaxanthinifaciens]|uniref:DNA mismatch repair protein MutT n=1 Tax=Siansivirga zeaxanthinifaciens CC-SAMT-1 TaxID=1454006 RepID=A0A0C5VV88_9FLAO|nr:NUDIX domain-containing protein [Siansivirga zeaxanthinifaciens]AJR03051.1 DNA mismatch repair protein MutT [Siansivirga zeaxanthinifaciens CC-SAMT-1]